ncbi:lipopolysaccharide biosynthesis protein [Clostridium butyricum]|uniref:lipopolysaccharide biosynthesis protein n=1 Tax=Clostridium butyricum TaxID=1492 RepID=UPI003D359463
MKNKQLTINMMANIFSFAVNIGISFFFTPYLIRTVGKEAYGFFPLANNFIGYVNIITIALNSMASRFITIKIHENESEEANKYFNSVLMSNTIIALLLIIPSLIFVIFINNILQIPIEIIKEVQILFGLVFIGMILNILTSVFGVATFVKNRLDLSSKRNIESNIIRVIILFLLFYQFTPSVLYIGVANLFVIVYILITNIKYTKILLPEIKISRKYFEIRKVKELLSSGVWNSINQLSIVLLTGLDLLIANILINPTSAGEYSIVKMVPNFIQSLVCVLVGVFVPQFTILYAHKKEKELLNSINNSIKCMGLLITIPIAFLIGFGDTFYSLWVPGEDSNLLHLLSNLTIIPMIITGSINTIFNVYTVTNKLKMPALVLLGTAIVNVICVLILIKTTNLGIIAIPLVSFVLDTLQNLIFTPIYSAKCLNVKWDTFYKAIFRGSFCAVTMLIICLIFKSIFNIDSWIKLILTGGICSLLALSINIFIVLKKSERQALIDTFICKVHLRKETNIQRDNNI